MTPVMPFIPAEIITFHGPVNINQDFINSLTSNSIKIAGDVIVDTSLIINNKLTLYITGSLTINTDIIDNVGLATYSRNLTIFHYGNTLDISSSMFSGNIYIESGRLNINRDRKINIYGSIISSGGDINLSVQNGNINFLGFIYAPYSKIKISSNNLFVDKGSIVGGEIWIDGHYKVEKGRISNILE